MKIKVNQATASEILGHRLTPAQQLHAEKKVQRFVYLIVGLILFGLAEILLIRSNLGAMSWDVLNLGLANKTGLSLGTLTIIIGLVVLLLWIPLRELPGVGTVFNIFVIGFAQNVFAPLIGTGSQLWEQILLLVAGLILLGFADAMYLGARFGAGPRDGLMTGLVRITKQPVGLIRTILEVTVVLVGWLLGGTVGIGTILIALTLGSIVQFFLPYVLVVLEIDEAILLTKKD